MKDIKTVSIIGMGALGILYADHLSKEIPKRDLRVVVDGKRKERYESQGLYCNGEACDFHYVLPEERIEPADLLIVAVKYTNLPEAIESVRHHVGDDTIILSVLNGIESEKDIGRVYGQEHMLYCVAQGMTAAKNGNQMTYKHKGILCFGELDQKESSEKVLRLQRFFDSVKMPYQVNNHMALKLWSKLMVNVGINQTVAYYGATNEVVQKKGKARDMMIEAMEEVVAVARQEGIGLTSGDIDYWLQIIDGLNPQGSPSMAQDVAANRPSEVELFSGTISRLGSKYKLEVPVNDSFYSYFTRLEQGYQ